MMRDHHDGSALKRVLAMVCSFSGWPAVIRDRRKMRSAKVTSVPARATAPSQEKPGQPVRCTAPTVSPMKMAM